jgi:hypothetical protein
MRQLPAALPRGVSLFAGILELINGLHGIFRDLMHVSCARSA